ncbi:hypothetical protein LT85_0506 [Collimonas arenae]|uniref:Uncharacterized protein n=1 Tax=Collimonas arenae TaxID=279058 RepID=A0A0A1F546_9BURK|nr:hypothetical protein [Collimonas arenae]AIY39666.1 hypothetical protein LT85_0506 [Collimonas arenae]
MMPATQSAIELSARPATRAASMPAELVLAIGLIWGHLNARQFEPAYQLAAACLCVWPDQPAPRLMSAYAAVELGHPLPPDTLVALHSAACPEWSGLVLRRAGQRWDGNWSMA